MLRRLATCLGMAMVCLTLAIPSKALDLDLEPPELPTLVNSNTQAVSGEEIRLGRTWLRQFRAHASAWDDPITQAYVEALVARLLPHTSLSGIEPITTLVGSARLNAFAVPGGVIGINAGLFAFAEQEASLVSVVAHELGHLEQRHYARRKARAEQTQIPTMAAMLAGMLIAAGGGGDAGIAAAMGSQAAFVQDQLAYSRRFEHEADRRGLQIMASAGYAPQAMVDMFRTMQRMISLQGGNPPEFLLTHPVTQSRISDAQSRVDQLATEALRTDSLAYQLVRARSLLAIHHRDPRQAQTRLEKDDVPQDARRYLQALIDAEEGRPSSALESLDALSEQHPDLSLLPATAADIALETGLVEQAIARSRQQLRLMPGYFPARLVLGEALLQRDANAAYQVLRDLANDRREDPRVFALLAEAAGHSGRKALGHVARAEQLQLTGRIDQGIEQLEIARDIAEQQGDDTTLAQIAQRRDTFIDYRNSMEDFR
ncbi:M48 family metalloprotease [Halomonas almeriensis]|uniref:M48 family metalloprotease n=1 Tax=Halomonas almeriensis TaxID=308163 RepID=UPI0025B569D2|nr:M48 family metalloprotease [Halomonas almeriensis]MDN3553499.1 M48 family metalloprotease [Halomonas almeriensis]